MDAIGHTSKTTPSEPAVKTVWWERRGKILFALAGLSVIGLVWLRWGDTIVEVCTGGKNGACTVDITEDGPTPPFPVEQ